MLYEPIFHSARTSWTLVGNSADSPEPLLRPSPATGHEAEILDVSDPCRPYSTEAAIRRHKPLSVRYGFPFFLLILAVLH